MPPLPTITVVIPVRNGASHLRRALPAVAAQDYPGSRRRLLVVDNGSTDGSADVARANGARVITCPRPGVSRAREAGWRAARGQLVAYLDADCVPPRDWLSRAAAPFAEDRKLGAVGVRLVDAKPESLAERHIIASRFLDTDFFWRQSWLHFPFVVTAGMVARRAALEDVGGFDLSFGRATGEDADICWRLRDAGWRVHYDRDILVEHHHRATLPAMLRQVHWYGWGSAEVFARHQKRLGHRHYVDPAPYKRLGIGLARLLPRLLTGKGTYGRVAPALQVLDAVAFLLGKWRGALRNRVLFF